MYLWRLRRKGLCFFEWNGEDECMGGGLGEDQIWSRKAKKWFTVVGRGDNNLRTLFFHLRDRKSLATLFDVGSLIVLITHTAR